MKKCLLLPAIIASSILVINSGCAKPANSLDTKCDATVDHPCLVQDSDGTAKSVKNYRDGAILAAAYKGNNTGLSNLRLSASVTPNQQDLMAIAMIVNHTTQGQITKIIDLDLREETHGIVNGNPVTLTIKNDWINLGKSSQQIIAEETAWQASLLNQKVLHNVLTPTQFKGGDYNAGIDIPVNSVQSEESIANAEGFTYIRLTISDHMAPKPADVDQFITLVETLPPGVWLHLHCRGGKGRTTTFLAIADMLQNADKVSLEDIIKRQASVAPFEDLSQVDNKNPDLKQYYQQRYDFTKAFYQYALARKHGYHGTWSEWVANQRP